MITVYIASPYTLGDVGKNVGLHMKTANDLIGRGFCVIAPLLFHFLHIVYPRNWETWIKVDLELMSRADVVYRVIGKSAGADLETREAEKLGIPVVYSIDELGVWVFKQDQKKQKPLNQKGKIDHG
jgi:hypothetical protein